MPKKRKKRTKVIDPARIARQIGLAVEAVICRQKTGGPLVVVMPIEDPEKYRIYGADATEIAILAKLTGLDLLPPADPPKPKRASKPRRARKP